MKLKVAKVLLNFKTGRTVAKNTIRRLKKIKFAEANLEENNVLEYNVFETDIYLIK